MKNQSIEVIKINFELVAKAIAGLEIEFKEQLKQLESLFCERLQKLWLSIYTGEYNIVKGVV
jgi:hypothetical protein